MMVPRRVLFLAGSLAVASCRAEVDDAVDPFGLIAWMNDPSRGGGYFLSEKQAIRAKNSNDSKPYYGIFATQDIAKDEVLLRVPWHSVLDGDAILNAAGELVNEVQEDGSIFCGTVQGLLTELQSIDSSHYKPYLEYLMHQSLDSVPAKWSVEGQGWLEQLLDVGHVPPSEPFGFLTQDWAVECVQESMDAGVLQNVPLDLQHQAALWVLTRSDDQYLIPIYDMYNHRNGAYLNTKTTRHIGQWYQVVASRNIKKGEEIYNSYNQCEICVSRRWTFGTAEMFKTYGFVEDYPHRWILLEEDLEFDVVETTPQLVVTPKDDADDDENTADVPLTNLTLKWLPNNEPDVTDLYLLRHKLQDVERWANVAWKRFRNILGATKAAMAAKEQARRKAAEESFDAMTGAKENQEEEDEAAAAKEEEELKQEKQQILSELKPTLEEWDMIWDYHKALVTGLKLAIEDLAQQFDQLPCLGGTWSATNQSCVFVDTYPSLLEAPVLAELEHNQHVCDNAHILQFANFERLEHTKTHYQRMHFDKHLENDDVCMDLDNTLQICDNYRPHYHEYAVHFPAQYIESVKRVIFIGGGDSMLLHEVLKYPDLELVVGLEIDQQVVRKSFKYFETQAHFEDPRVEWWFGDATKSLLLLPQEEYAQSFDLVLVDLSETVTSLSVTEELDILGALSLFLKPSGVMVKNEHYYEKLSKFFDYTVQIFYESPTLCTQSMTMGSNTVDFWKAPTYTHKGVDTKVMEFFQDHNDRFTLLQDYGQGNAIASGECNRTFAPMAPNPDKSAGMVVIVELENIPEDVSLLTVNTLIQETAESVGWTFVEALSVIPSVVIFQEGYIAAYTVPDLRYCALDIYLWGSFGTADAIRAAMTKAFVGSSQAVTSYRIVVGGMLGTTTWEQDQLATGPKLQQTRNCTPKDQRTSTYKAALVTEQMRVGAKEAAVTQVLETLLELPPKNGSVEHNIIVLCGTVVSDDPDDEDCLAREVLDEIDAVQYLYVMNTCGELLPDDQILPQPTANMAVATLANAMYQCELDIWRDLDEMVQSSGRKFTGLVMDQSATKTMTKIFDDLLTKDRELNALFDLDHASVFVGLSKDNAEPWKRHCMADIRLSAEYHPIFGADMVVGLPGTQGAGSLGVSMIVQGVEEKTALSAFAEIETKIAEHAMVPTDMLEVRGGRENFNPDFVHKFFTHGDYDHSAAQAQFQNQVPLARQMILQLKVTPDDDDDDENTPTTTPKVLKSKRMAKMLQTILQVDMKQAATVVSTVPEGVVGKGFVVSATVADGDWSILVVFNGKDQLDVNYFSRDESEDSLNLFVAELVDAVSDYDLQVALRDDQPRGIHHVMNFERDMKENVSNLFYEDRSEAIEADSDPEEDDEDDDSFGAEL